MDWRLAVAKSGSTLMLACAVCAIGAVITDRYSKPPAPARVRLRAPMPEPLPEPSALPNVWTVTPLPAGSGPAQPEAPKRPPIPGLTPEEQAALEAAVGPMPESARELGAAPGKLFNIAPALSRYPNVVRYVLDNDEVLEGFMSQQRVRRNCENAGDLVAYLSEPGDPTGTTALLDALRKTLDTPGSAQAVFGSKLAKRAIFQCPAAAAVSDDPRTALAVATRNPLLVSLISDSRMVAALAATPEISSRVMKFRPNLGLFAPR